MGSEEFSHFLLFFLVFLRFSSFFFFLRFSSLFFAFLLEDKGEQLIYCKNWEFHSDPVCTDPVRNFPNLGTCKLEEDKRATTNVYNGLAMFFLFSLTSKQT